MPENMPFKRIVIHCSASEFGHALMIRDWHVQKRWTTIGYHVVVLNSYPTADWLNKGISVPYLDGSVEWGRAVDSDEWFESHEIGAHVEGMNTGSFGICMIGEKNFSNTIRNSTLAVVRFHMNQFKLTSKDIFGHCELNPNKPLCPGIDMNEFRKMIDTGKNYGEKTIVTLSDNNGVVKTPIVEILKSFLKGIFS